MRDPRVDSDTRIYFPHLSRGSNSFAFHLVASGCWPYLMLRDLTVIVMDEEANGNSAILDWQLVYRAYL